MNRHAQETGCALSNLEKNILQRGDLVAVISLWRPWADWVVLGWKTIETRKHRNFASLVGRTIAIHASQKFDYFALDEAAPYWDNRRPRVIDYKLAGENISGAIIGTVHVDSFRPLTADDAGGALIECESVQRYGLFLSEPKLITPVPCRGKQGIWYVERERVEA